MTRIKLGLATVLSLAFTPLAAQDFQTGWDAYNAGDYSTALQEWTPLAEAGDAKAQYTLGVMYRQGYGVLQDVLSIAQDLEDDLRDVQTCLADATTLIQTRLCSP